MILRESNQFSRLIAFIEGASHLFPEAWDEYLAPIPEAERQDLILAYHAQLNSVDDATRIQAAKAWSKWECVEDLFAGCWLIILTEWRHRSYM